MRKQYRLENNRLYALFTAGHGEFHVFNNKRLIQFNLSFKRGDFTVPVSYVGVCFTAPDANRLYYYNLGKYDFSQRKLWLRTRPEVSQQTLDTFTDALMYLAMLVYTGSPFPPEFELFYSGHCCRCGMKLKDQESLKLGLGPECKNKPDLTEASRQFFLFT